MNSPTYAEVGATRPPARLPTGYNHLRVETKIGGPETFETAARAVLSWRMHRAAGMLVTAEPAHEGQQVVGRLGPFRVPCQVIWTIREPARTGFGYGTLPGHPERGEEAFVVELRADGVWFVVTAFSRPAAWFTRAAGPLTVLLQHGYAHHLGLTLRRLVRTGAAGK